MINNLSLLKPLFTFEKKGEFYYALIILRKKDGTTDKSNKEHARVIKTYCFDSIEEFDKRWDEIVNICETFKARCYIYTTPDTFKRTSFAINRKILDDVENEKYNHEYVFDTVVKKSKIKQRHYIIDIDTKDPLVIERYQYELEKIRPQGEKILLIIPTLNGVHLLCKRFDVETFYNTLRNQGENIVKDDIKIKAPTLLFLPTSLQPDILYPVLLKV